MQDTWFLPCYNMEEVEYTLTSEFNAFLVSRKVYGRAVKYRIAHNLLVGISAIMSGMKTRKLFRDKDPDLSLSSSLPVRCVTLSFAWAFSPCSADSLETLRIWVRAFLRPFKQTSKLWPFTRVRESRAACLPVCLPTCLSAEDKTARIAFAY